MSPEEVSSANFPHDANGDDTIDNRSSYGRGSCPKMTTHGLLEACRESLSKNVSIQSGEHGELGGKGFGVGCNKPGLVRDRPRHGDNKPPQTCQGEPVRLL